MCPWDAVDGAPVARAVRILTRVAGGDAPQRWPIGHHARSYQHLASQATSGPAACHSARKIAHAAHRVHAGHEPLF
jgi:hypothetical protein